MTRPKSRTGKRLGGAGHLGLAGAGALLLFAAVVLALAEGSVPIPARVVLAALLGGEGADPAEQQIIRELRLPRVLGAVLVGMALAAVGAVLQAVMRNPLADPYILGISSGASVGAALAAVVGLAALGPFGPMGLAFLTALGSVLLVYRVARVGGRLPPVRLLLAGVALSSFATAVTGFILFFAPEAAAVRGVLFWLMGGLGGLTWGTLGLTALVALPAMLVVLATARWQTTLLLGDEAALSLGLDVTRTRTTLVIVSALLTSTLVAAAGAIGFVGLIVPHALRPFTGPDHRRLLPAAMIFGALLLVVMDLLARTLLAPQEIPVGILTGLLGAPFFLLLLSRQAEASHG